LSAQDASACRPVSGGSSVPLADDASNADQPLFVPDLTRHVDGNRPDHMAFHGSSLHLQHELGGALRRRIVDRDIVLYGFFERGVNSNYFVCVLRVSAYVYVCIQDPRIDHQVFKLTPKDHIVTICSAGLLCFEF
jgi:hypothetical protein